MRADAIPVRRRRGGAVAWRLALPLLLAIAVSVVAGAKEEAANSTLTASQSSSASSHPSRQPANVTDLLRDTPLIPVELLYGQPLVADPQLSPDGAWLSYLAPSQPNNTLNVFVVPVRNSSSPPPPPPGSNGTDNLPKAFQLTRESSFDIEPGQYQWSTDSKYILYLYDPDPAGGDRYRLWKKDLSKPSDEAVDLIPEFSTVQRNGTGQIVESSRLPPGLRGDKLHIGQFFLSSKVPGWALVTIDERSPGIFDVYRLDLSNGDLELDTVNPGDVASWVPDKFLRVRGAKALLPQGGGAFRTREVRSPLIDLGRRQRDLERKRREDNSTLSKEDRALLTGSPIPDSIPDEFRVTSEWREATRWNASDVFVPVSAAGHAFAFTNRGNSVLVLTNANASAVRLLQLSARDGRVEKVLAEGERGKGKGKNGAEEDVVATAFDAATGDLAAFATERLRRRWRTTSRAWDPDSALVNRALNGSDEFSVASKAADNSRVILRFVSDVAPPTYYLLDRRDKKNHTFTKQVTELPGLERFELAHQRGVEIRARDGLMLPSYLSLPPAWVRANESWSRSIDGKKKKSGDDSSSSQPPGPLPLVVVVRAQPWARDSFGFTPAVQAIANAGAAVLQVNFRGSGGFGRRFVAAGAGEWGRGMTEDLVDAVEWAVDEGIADPDRVAIFGFSYGGYAALDALTTHPEVFGCAASLSGAARVESTRLLNPAGWIPPRPEPGSEREREFEERGREVSPLSHVGSLRGASNSSGSRPRQSLLQAVGGRDDPALISAARELDAAARSRGLRTEFLLYPLEGHTLRLDESRVDFGSRLTRFLSECLGISDGGEGRVPPPVVVEDAVVEVSSSSPPPPPTGNEKPRLVRLEDRPPALNTTERIEEAGARDARGEARVASADVSSPPSSTSP